MAERERELYGEDGSLPSRHERRAQNVHRPASEDGDSDTAGMRDDGTWSPRNHVWTEEHDALDEDEAVYNGYDDEY